MSGPRGEVTPRGGVSVLCTEWRHRPGLSCLTSEGSGGGAAVRGAERAAEITREFQRCVAGAQEDERPADSRPDTRRKEQTEAGDGGTVSTDCLSIQTAGRGEEPSHRSCRRNPVLSRVSAVWAVWLRCHGFNRLDSFCAQHRYQGLWPFPTRKPLKSYFST